MIGWISLIFLRSGETAEFGDLPRPAFRLGGFEDQRDAVEPRVGHHPPEELPAQHAVAERRMAVEMAPDRALRVIEMHPAQQIEADEFVEAGEEGVGALRRRQIVTGGESVAGVDADPAASSSSERPRVLP